MNVLTPVDLPVALPVALALLAAMFFAAVGLRRTATPLADRIDALLPQTQCRQCGFDGCRPYAQAIASGEADINRCPPGGDRVIRRLAACTGRPPLPLDASRGEHKKPLVALIDEANCIGCTLCIQACPVDAIVGAPKVMHTVIARQCTGCELCLPACPVDCIELVPVRNLATALVPGHRGFDRDAARTHHEQRKLRLAREKIEHAARMAVKAEQKLAVIARSDDPARERKQAAVAAALARARARLAAAPASAGRD
jgi:electron transport complex protein RnfB